MTQEPDDIVITVVIHSDELGRADLPEIVVHRIDNAELLLVNKLGLRRAELEAYRNR